MAAAAGSRGEALLLDGAALWRRVRRRLRTGPLVRWRFAGPAPSRLILSPPDLRPADPQVAADIYAGRFPLDGHAVEPGAASPFAVTGAGREWAEALHGFRWLRHMRAAGSPLAAANARALAADWIAGPGRHIGGVAWAPGVSAQRIVAWLMHAPMLLAGADPAFQRSFLRSLGMQVRFLRAVAAEIPDAGQRLHARIALAFAALCLPAGAAGQRRAAGNLAAEIDRQILPDGGHVSRNPDMLVDLLLDLLPLRQTFASRDQNPPEALHGAVERMLPMLRFFRHGDGTLARFNGVGAAAHDRINAVLRHDDAQGAPLAAAPYSGYQRLALGNTVVIADTGPGPPLDASREAHAGCLAFEMSSGGGEMPGGGMSRPRQFIVNAGTDRLGAADFRPLARATAAHSTAVLNDASSARFRPVHAADGLLGAPLTGGPRHVPVERSDTADAQAFAASHDGYAARFGLVHRRELTLSEGGGLLAGLDTFADTGGQAPGRSQDRAALRFHLHPEVELLRDAEGALVAHVPGGDSWTFHSPDLAPQIEESIFFASLQGPRRSRQVVLAFTVATRPEVRWWWRRRVG